MKFLKCEIVIRTDMRTDMKTIQIYGREGESLHITNEFSADDLDLELIQARFWIIEHVVK